MDEHTLKILEFDKIRALVAAYLPNRLIQDLGAELEPSTDLEVIRNSQRLTTEMVRALALGRNPPLAEIADVRGAVRRASAEAVLPSETLRDVAGTLHSLARLRDYLIRLAGDCPALSQRSFDVHDVSPLSLEIEGCIDSQGRLLDSASRELSRLRYESEKIEERIRTYMRRLLRTESVKRALRYPNFTVAGSHYVLPIARDHRHEVPGVVHRASSSGETLFIEPAEVAELSTELALLRRHEAREVQRILRRLSAEVGKHSWEILRSLETAAELSCVCAKARYALAYRMVQPAFSDDGTLWLDKARHPLLEYLVRNQAASGPQAAEPNQGANAPHSPTQHVVPIDVRLGGRFEVLLLTGPNTGGKTVALKTVGLLAAMAQSGLHITAAEGSKLPLFDQVLADIGDEQSIEQSLSTFSAHVSHIAAILGRATKQSLVLLDELGAGTDPSEGAALGRAILDELLQRGPKAIVTTHLGDLKLYGLTHAGVENAAVEFDTETLRPTYRVRIGDTGRSSALVIARRLNLPAGLVDRAEQYLAEAGTRRPQEIDALEGLRAEAEAARTAAWQAEQEARRAREAYQARLDELDKDAAAARALAEFRASLQPGTMVFVPKFRRPATVLRVDQKRRRATVVYGAVEWELELDQLEPAKG